MHFLVVMVHHYMPVPVKGIVPAVEFENLPGKSNFEAVPLTSWSWTKQSILDQTRPKPPIQHDNSPPEPEFQVTPAPYNTPYKAGQLIRLNFPIAKSSFL